MRILLVEDNPQLTRTLCEALQAVGMVIDHVGDGLHADQILLSENFDAVVLDLSLPRLDGLAVLRRLRQRGADVPVLILTARSETEERVQGLNEGADDYLAKPFSLDELEARLRALVRRRQGHVARSVHCGPLQYDQSARLFSLAGQPLTLPPREHGVLETLILHNGYPVSKEAIGDQLCGLDDFVTPDAIEIYVHRLRKRFEHTAIGIRTLRGLGYLLEAKADHAPHP
jgi:two-component system response regulator TctD